MIIVNFKNYVTGKKAKDPLKVARGLGEIVWRKDNAKR